MSGYEQDQPGTMASVVLSKPDDWDMWLFMRKDTADIDGLWPYVNPSLSADELAQLQDEKPQEKPLWRFKKTQVSKEEQEDIDIEDLSAEEILVYNTWARKFEQEEGRWLQKKKALASFNCEIAKTIDVKHLDLIFNCPDPYSRLTTLKKHLCPSVDERDRQLRSRYQAVCTRPREASLDAWLDEWMMVARLLEEAKMPEAEGNRAQEDFILSIRGLDDKWAARQLIELINKEHQGQQYTSTVDLVTGFRSYYRYMHPNASSLSPFAMLSATPSTDGLKTLAVSPQRRTTCLCGDSHRFKDCLYVNSSLRQSNWMPDRAVEMKFNELRQAGSYKAKVLRRVEAQLRKEGKPPGEGKKQSVICMHDGQPIRSTTHCNTMLQTTAATNSTQYSIVS